MKKNILVFLLTSFYSFGFVPNHLDGYKIKFDWGGNENSIIKFGKDTVYEIADETGSNPQFVGDYDANTEGNTITVTIFSQFDASDVYTLNFTTAVTGSGRLDDYVTLQPNQVDDSFRLIEGNTYLDLVGSVEFRFDVLESPSPNLDTTTGSNVVPDPNTDFAPP